MSASGPIPIRGPCYEMHHASQGTPCQMLVLGDIGNITTGGKAACRKIARTRRWMKRPRKAQLVSNALKLDDARLLLRSKKSPIKARIHRIKMSSS
jgi:hypothetical protein